MNTKKYFVYDVEVQTNLVDIDFDKLPNQEER